MEIKKCFILILFFDFIKMSQQHCGSPANILFTLLGKVSVCRHFNFVITHTNLVFTVNNCMMGPASKAYVPVSLEAVLCPWTFF